MLRPHEFAEPKNKETKEPAGPQLWELPDTNILFRRYLDSGKMINVYDWFESFRLVLETQRNHLKKHVIEQGSPKKTPSKGKSKGKGKQGQRVTEEDEDEDEEKWKMEVQARFMGALQELDYLGFIKHTGRKADHVQRTVFDISD